MLQHSANTDHNIAPAPRATYFSDKQKGEYLANLRQNRVPRPNGSRPPPAYNNLKRDQRVKENGRRSSSSGSHDDTSHSRSSSALSYYQGTGSVSSSGRVSPEKMFIPPKRTSQERQREKEEAHAMRLALERVDSSDEQALHLAAHKEAADLVWKHEHPHAPHRLQPKGELVLQEGTGESQLAIAETGEPCNETSRPPSSHNAQAKLEADTPSNQPRRSASKRLRESLSISRLTNRRRSSASTRNPSGTLRKPSFPNAEEKIWEDKRRSGEMQPEEVPESAVPSHVRRNPFARIQSLRQGQHPGASQSKAWSSRTNIHRNPPTQSTNPIYKHNEPIVESVANQEDEQAENGEQASSDVKYKDGVEVRSEDIRAATSMRMKDRSPRLPSPTVVSGSPGRPIVSFSHDWQPSERDQQAGTKTTNQMPCRPGPVPLRDLATPHATASAPVVPTINFQQPAADDVRAEGATEEHLARPVPQICLPNDSAESPMIDGEDFHARTAIPSVSISTTPDLTVSTPVPAINVGIDHPIDQKRAPKSRPQPRHADTAPISLNVRPHWSRAANRNAALCAQCALPIGGRIVSAAGTRFHPHCFACHHCGEGLECVAFYPEPAAKREARLERAERRMTGEEVEPPEGQTLADDNDDALRFYCHLDFHEFFSPRCKSCKTPIEGQVVVACGAEWHVGHFFCAQCGDPFDASTPFVEKDGYAWCVGCHTNRTSARCKKCRKPVTDMVLKALGAEWHEACFRCRECEGRFRDGKYFLRGDSQDPVCSECEARRLKA